MIEEIVLFVLAILNEFLSLKYALREWIIA
jgi:hypothetical protein